jgi:FixJ family two-component response regulator
MGNFARILIADDEAAIAESTSDLLHLQGFECATAPDGAAAAALLRQTKYDLLIADIHMAGNGQLELIEELAAHGIGMPIILMTGYPDISTAIKALKLPVVAYLVKPFEFGDLLKEVRAAIQHFGLKRVVCDAHLRAENTCQSLREISESMKTMHKGISSAPLSTFFSLTLENIVNGLFDWERLTESLLVSKESQAALQLAEGSLVKGQRTLLEETIKTIEKTKGAFKSKELGELRKRLQECLKGI